MKKPPARHYVLNGRFLLTVKKGRITPNLYITWLLAKLKNKLSLENGEIPVEQLEAVRRGDHQAYKAVYMYYRGPIQHFLYGLLRSREEAEEISQHVFLVLWEKRGSLDVSKNIRTLLYTIARNAVMNLYKRL